MLRFVGMNSASYLCSPVFARFNSKETYNNPIRAHARRRSFITQAIIALGRAGAADTDSTWQAQGGESQHGAEMFPSRSSLIHDQPGPIIILRLIIIVIVIVDDIIVPHGRYELGQGGLGCVTWGVRG